ncbi:hypothetical protein Val02_54930 [Virgisporangium aliadipatigenens]|uniref:Uncharacterized protein n=1 Tax=Virgisporangium aliadipatigenens TaxID=741659 RepID=A0A8J3YQI7_9ACTN|nr:hypothetical protein [Virgisporangium aliadipatigenens]GIJ48607.1 hypothetical protein Val02_54930 [Virgisporangium aliadipatigenens]
MADLDRILRGSMHENAERAPQAVDLLGKVHQRSDRLVRRRRRLTTVAAAVAVLVSGGIAAPVLMNTGRQDGPPPAARQTETTAAASPEPTTTRAVTIIPPPPSAESGPPIGTGTQVTFADGAVTPPQFPYRPGFAPVGGGFQTPLITMENGDLVGFFEAVDGDRGADVTIRVGSRKPTFDGGGAVSESSERVRGKTAVLRTVDKAQTDLHILYWQESATQWIRIDTDDTYTTTQVLEIGESLRAAGLPAVLTLRPDRIPNGLPVRTTTPSTLAFGPAEKSAISVVLRKPRALTGPTVAVGEHRGVVNGSTLSVAIDGFTLEVTVGDGYRVDNAELIRFAAGIKVSDSAEPAQS